jgi:hypothetical protein
MTRSSLSSTETSTNERYLPLSKGGRLKRCGSCSEDWNTPCQDAHQYQPASLLRQVHAEREDETSNHSHGLAALIKTRAGRGLYMRSQGKALPVCESWICRGPSRLCLSQRMGCVLYQPWDSKPLLSMIRNALSVDDPSRSGIFQPKAAS